MESIDANLGAFVQQVLIVADHWHRQAVVAPARLHLDTLFDQVDVSRAGMRQHGIRLRHEVGLLFDRRGGVCRLIFLLKLLIVLLKLEVVDYGLKLVHDGFRRVFADTLGLLSHLVKIFPDLRKSHLLLQGICLRQVHHESLLSRRLLVLR